MYITHLYDLNGYYIALQHDLNSTTFYYPAILITADNVSFLFPKISTYDEANQLPLGFFNPPTISLKMALFEHNRNNYRPSLNVESLSKNILNIKTMELIADELTFMDSMGLAF